MWPFKSPLRQEIAELRAALSALEREWGVRSAELDQQVDRLSKLYHRVYSHDRRQELLALRRQTLENEVAAPPSAPPEPLESRIRRELEQEKGPVASRNAESPLALRKRIAGY